MSRDPRRWLVVWAVASHERALANARTAATECGRLAVERGEVARFLASRTPSGHDDERAQRGSESEVTAASGRSAGRDATAAH